MATRPSRRGRRVGDAPLGGIEALATRTVAERDHVAAGRRAPTGADQPRAHLGKVRNARTTDPRIHGSPRRPALRLAVTRAAAAPGSGRPARAPWSMASSAPVPRATGAAGPTTVARRSARSRAPTVAARAARPPPAPAVVPPAPLVPRRPARASPPVLFPPFPVALEPPVEPAIPAPLPPWPAELPPVDDPPAPPLPVVPPAPVPAGPESLPQATKPSRDNAPAKASRGLRPHPP